MVSKPTLVKRAAKDLGVFLFVFPFGRGHDFTPARCQNDGDKTNDNNDDLGVCGNILGSLGLYWHIIPQLSIWESNLCPMIRTISVFSNAYLKQPNQGLAHRACLLTVFRRATP